MDKYRYSFDISQYETEEPEAAAQGRTGLFANANRTIEQKVDESQNIYKTMTDMLSAFYGSSEKAKETVNKGTAEDLASISLDVFDEWTLQSSEEHALITADPGLTPSDYTNEQMPVQEAEIPDVAPVSLERSDQVVYNTPQEMSDLEILARTIEAEAGNQGLDGKTAVGAVIANRAAAGNYGKGIKGVILKRGQFSPWNSYTGYAKGEQGKDMMRLQPSEDAYTAAEAILSGNYEDTTKGATHYVNPSVSTPDWLDDMKGRKRGTIKIGTHLFGNADNNKTYDGKAWIATRLAPPRPKYRPED